MDLEIKWYKPLKLKISSKREFIYEIDGIDIWNGWPGVYMFCRKYSGKIETLYIGKAEDLGKRIKQHLNNLSLMKNITHAQSGDKILVLGELIGKPGQQPKNSIHCIEKALIERALSQGHDLLNKQGKKTPMDHISFSGYLPARNFTGKSIHIKKNQRAK